MIIETKEQRKERMFAIYKEMLEKLNENLGWLRFIVIEYRCTFPKIDPYEMAAILHAEGVRIVFDDSTISSKANERKKEKVARMSDAIKCFKAVKVYEGGGVQDE